MKKEIKTKGSEDPTVVREPAIVYATPHHVHFDVTIEDDSMIMAVKEALQMIKGVTSVSLSNVNNIDPFAELDTKWGGDRDANEIADELHSMRSDFRTVSPW